MSRKSARPVQTQTLAICRTCRTLTKHDELFFANSEPFHEDESYFQRYGVLRCRGCATVTFRLEATDYSDPVEDEDGGLTARKTITQYPKVGALGMEQLSGLWYVPELVKKIYEESVTAYRENAFTLAGVGFRATIEAVCSEKKIAGRSLEDRITKLSKVGAITESQANLLHAVRFLGNDAAHEIRTPTGRELLATAKIVQHLLNALYIVDKEARLPDRIIGDYQTFEGLITDALRKSAAGKILTLPELLGKNIRRTMERFATFEKKFLEEVDSGRFEYLAVDKVEEESGKALRTYKVLKVPPDDDFPF